MNMGKIPQFLKEELERLKKEIEWMNAYQVRLPSYIAEKWEWKTLEEIIWAVNHRQQRTWLKMSKVKITIRVRNPHT